MIEPRRPRGRDKPQGPVGLRRDAEKVAGALPPGKPPSSEDRLTKSTALLWVAPTVVSVSLTIKFESFERLSGLRSNKR